MKAFFDRVLPQGGNYIVSSIDGVDGAREVRGIKTTAEIEKVVQRISLAGKTNIYYAVGTFGADRKTPIAKRCLYVDLDPKDFGDKATALKELAAFCKTVGFPGPSIYIDSGRGIHGIWTFTSDLGVEPWRALAGKLKERCIAAGFAADPVVTADAARILRVPGTLNNKVSPGVPCRVLKDTGVDYDPAALLRALMPVATGAIAALAGLVDNDALGNAPAATSYPQVPYYASEIAEKCGVFKEALETGGRDHTEPQWRHLLSLLTFTEDGGKYVHEISRGHVGYTEAGADRKYQQVVALKSAGTLKPILCSTFAGYKGSICKACPFNGNIKTPMVLGKLESVQYLPPGYRMGDYSVDKLVKRGDVETPDIWATVFPYRILDVDVYSHGTGAARQISLSCLTKRTSYRIDIETDALVNQGEILPIALSRAGLNITTAQLGEFKHIMAVWMRKMEDVKTNVSVEQKGLGWGKRGGKDVFAAGPHVYGAGAKRFDFYYKDAKLLASYSPTGDYVVWKRAAQALAADPRQAAVCTLLTAFAAPLTPFAGVKGLTYSLYSSGSGTGKSVVLRTAQAVWGHPTTGMAMIDDTQLSVINRLGFLNTIPAYWDEMRSGDTLIAFVKMIFTLGQGREKSRLTSGIKQQDTSTWDTLITIASNERLADHVDRYIKNTDAGRLRLFEVTMPPLTNPDPALAQVFSKLEHNFGHAGVEWAKWLVDNRQLAIDTVQSLQLELAKKVTKNSNERFWTAFVALILSAAVLVQRAGILTLDVKKLQQWLISQHMAQQGGVAESYSSPAEAAQQSVVKFIDQHRDQMLLVDVMHPPLGVMRNVLTPANQMPRGEINILRSTVDKIVRIDRNAWRSWVSDVLKCSPTTFETELFQKSGFTMKRASMDAGLQNASNARRRVYEVQIDDPAFAGLFDQGI